jgi:phosphoribosylformimino-5-aminoimidazole carboxamide ribotide isomerase
VSLDLWPAIDIRAGKCVRLLRGQFSAETVYGDPLEQAEAFVSAGAPRLHIVDLDAAREGGSPNRHVVLQIASRAGVPVQVGGGIRDENAAAALFDGGVARVVLGTVAVEQPEVLVRIVGRWPGQVVVGLDHRAVAGPEGALRREVAVRGWVDSGGLCLETALQRLEDMPLGGVLVTDIERDGTGAGPDLAGLERVLVATGLPVLASGGIAGTADLAALAGLGSGDRRLAGAIVGRALLSGALTISEAVAACEQ